MERPTFFSSKPDTFVELFDDIKVPIGDKSISIEFLFDLHAATPVIPVPEKKSKTISFGDV